MGMSCLPGLDCLVEENDMKGDNTGNIEPTLHYNGGSCSAGDLELQSHSQHNP